jgi:hypothetical protein
MHGGHGALWVGVDRGTVRGSCLFSSNLYPLPWWVGWENAEAVLLSSLVLSFDPHRSSRMWLSHLVPTSSIHVYCHDMYRSTTEPKILFTCLSFSVLLLLSWFHSFDSHRLLWRVDQRKVNPPLFWLLLSQAPCMLVPILDLSTP